MPQAPWAPMAADGAIKVGDYPYDPGKAAQLLDWAGWVMGADGVRQKDGVRMSYDYWLQDVLTEREISEAIQGMLADVGVEIKLTLLDTATYRAKTTMEPQDAEYDMNILGGGAFTGGVDWFMKTFYHSSAWAPKYYNRSYYKNADVDELVDLGFLAKTPEERDHYFHEVLRIGYEDPPAIILFDVTHHNVMRADIVGVEMDPVVPISPAMFSRRAD